MGRKLKTPWLDVSEINRHVWNLAASHDPIPHDPRLLRAIIDALLMRIEQTRPEDVRMLRDFLQCMAASERDPGLPRLTDEQLQELYSPIVGALTVATPSRLTHHKSTVTFQRNWLAHYLNEHPYPTSTLKEREKWIRTHECMIWKFIPLIKCRCNYPESLNPTDKISACENAREAIDQILATLHNTTPAQIHKILTRKERKSSKAKTSPKHRT